jgi:hypothetical protein
MKPKKKPETKKLPTDSTMRNVRAANKRIKALENRIELLERIVFILQGNKPTRARR